MYYICITFVAHHSTPEASKYIYTSWSVSTHIFRHPCCSNLSKKSRRYLLQVSLADAQVHEFTHHLRDHLIMESVAIARFLPWALILNEKIFLRHNWLEDEHIIGRLLKPHTRGTIFINFAARNSLIAEKNSLVQSMFSVFPVFLQYSHLENLPGGERWSSAAYIWEFAEKILLACCSIPKDDGGERISWKPVRWSERFPLQVKHDKAIAAILKVEIHPIVQDKDT